MARCCWLGCSEDLRAFYNHITTWEQEIPLESYGPNPPSPYLHAALRYSFLITIVLCTCTPISSNPPPPSSQCLQYSVLSPTVLCTVVSAPPPPLPQPFPMSAVLQYSFILTIVLGTPVSGIPPPRSHFCMQYFRTLSYSQ